MVSDVRTRHGELRARQAVCLFFTDHGPGITLLLALDPRREQIPRLPFLWPSLLRTLKPIIYRSDGHQRNRQRQRTGQEMGWGFVASVRNPVSTGRAIDRQQASHSHSHSRRVGGLA